MAAGEPTASFSVDAKDARAGLDLNDLVTIVERAKTLGWRFGQPGRIRATTGLHQQLKGLSVAFRLDSSHGG